MPWVEEIGCRKAIYCLGVSAVAVISAAGFDAPANANQIEQLRQEVEELRALVQSYKNQLDVQDGRISTLETLSIKTAQPMDAPEPSPSYSYYPQYYPYNDGAQPVPANAPSAAYYQPAVQRYGSGQGSQTAQNRNAPTAGAPGGAPKREVELPAVARNQSALLPAGTLVAEPSFEYALTSLNRVVLEGFTVIPAITVGSIDIRDVDREAMVAANTFRLGVFDGFEADVKIPYVYRRDETTSRPIGTGASEDISQSTDGHGLGDVEVGLHYQLWDGTQGLPFIIFNTRLIAPTGEDPFEVDLDENGLEEDLPTGSGFFGVEPSFTAMIPSDPIVFFGTVGYLINIEDDKTLQDTNETIDVDPGDAFRMSFGLGFAVNESASLSLGYQHDVVFESEVDGETVDDSDLNIGKLLIGASYRVSENTSVNVSVGVGATEEAPDIDLLLRVPIRFSIF